MRNRNTKMFIAGVLMMPILVVLSGCYGETKTETRIRVEKQQSTLEDWSQRLPEGCKAYDLGGYDGSKTSISQVLMIRCAHSTTTTSGQVSYGKTSKPTTVTTDDE